MGGSFSGSGAVESAKVLYITARQREAEMQAKVDAHADELEKIDADLTSILERCNRDGKPFEDDPHARTLQHRKMTLTKMCEECSSQLTAANERVATTQSNLFHLQTSGSSADPQERRHERRVDAAIDRELNGEGQAKQHEQTVAQLGRARLMKQRSTKGLDRGASTDVTKALREMQTDAKMRRVVGGVNAASTSSLPTHLQAPPRQKQHQKVHLDPVVAAFLRGHVNENEN